jgi:hypothetical protein
VVLSHEREREDHAIRFLAELWREDGLEVVFLHGTQRFVPADVAIVHVDLSVVPDEYLEFARRYPVAVNAEVKDIRRCTYSTGRVDRDSDYDGSVIVKSNLNHAGMPERRLGVASGAAVDVFQEPFDYPLYESVAEVPERFFDEEHFIVERFRPELEDGLYHVRYLNFLGDRFTCKRLTARDPIVGRFNRLEEVEIEPHPEVLELRERFELGYGKLDYVVHEGRFELLDVNKTPGASEPSPEIDAARRHRAKGIYAYL